MTKYTLTELRNLQEDDELDLSACSIAEFPNPIVQLTRLTNLDLSSNVISILPESFCKMTKLVRLDLGNNGLHHLPDGIGFLINLQHLNLYNNKLEDLPNSFANLKSLKWLDLKKNPLNSKLLAIAGTCSSDAECKKAAKSVVDVYMGERKKAIDAQKAQEAKLRAKVQKAQEEEKIRKYQEKKKKQDAVKQEEKESKQRDGVKAAAPVPKAQKSKEAPKKASNESKKTAERPRGFFSKLFGFVWTCAFYLSVALITSSTIAIGCDCYGVGTPIPGTAPLCKDITRLGKFSKPSPLFLTNVKNAYGQVFNGYHAQVKPHVAPIQAKVSTQWKQFAKTDVGKKIEKTAYQVHSFVVEKFVQLQRFITKQSNALAAWWKKDGQKTFGPYLEGFLLGLKMVFQVVRDVALNIVALFVHFGIRAKTFFIAFTEGGFNAAMNTLNH